MFFLTAEHLLQEYNTLLDSFFYDTGKFTYKEKQRLIKEKNPEGSILVVSPLQDNESYISYPNVEEFSKSKHKSVTRFVIAGVGSSDLGAAALARNVADFYHEPVATIVAGYGIKDLLGESIDGWFSLGQSNEDSYQKEKHHSSNTSDDDIDFVAGNPDSNTMLKLLINENINIKLILGHSKGCLSLSNALFGMFDSAKSSLITKRIKNMQVVTTGAVINLPDELDLTYQFLGSYDWLGKLNSRNGLAFTPIEGCWHHTNTTFPLSMDIKAVLRQLTSENEVVS
jgi:hypothetical protein